jgi:putative transcriptional regulator
MQNVVFSMKEYGHIEIHLKELMEERGVTRNALARATNTRFEVINKWYHGHVEKIDADVLARICYILDCNPGDIILYTVSDENY